MSFFPYAQNTSIYGGSFANIQGGIHSYHVGGGMVIQQGDPVFHTLLPMTATGAAYDSEERYPPPKCHPNTRQAILSEIEAWINGEETSSGGSLLWLHGPAGAGKSAIAQTICESSARRGALAASFFFSRGHSRRGFIEFFFTTIAFQLMMSIRDLRDQIMQAISENPLIVHGATTAVQVKNLIVEPLQSRASAATIPPFLIVVDGLDECRGNDNQIRLLNNLIDLVHKHHLALRILIVSRPEPHIKDVFANTNVPNSRIVSLYDDHQADADIYSFLEDGFKSIHDAERHFYIMQFVPKPWPPDHVLQALVHKSGGYFIYASTVLGFVDAEYFSPVDRLNEIVNASPASPTTAFAELDKLYTQILSTSPNTSLLRSILGCVVIPLGTFRGVGPSLSMIETVYSLSRGMAMLTLRGLHSILSFEAEDHYTPHRLIKGEPGEIFIRSIHASFSDFVLDSERAGTFFVDIQEHHTDMAHRCWAHFAHWSELEPKIPVSVRQYLLHSFHFHFTQILEKRPVLDKLTRANTDTWAPFVRASTRWPIRDKLGLVTAIDDVASGFKTVDIPLHNKTMELDALFDFAYWSHLSPQSQGDCKFIQMIFRMFGQFSPHTSIPQQWDARSELVEFLQLSQVAQPYWRDIEAYLNASFERRRNGSPIHVAKDRNCRRRSFMDFMDDARRCGDMYIESGTSHARLALCCIKVLRAWNYSIGPAYTYAEEYLSKHLLRMSPAGDIEVLDYIRRFDVTSLHIVGRHGLVSSIVAWLESKPDPPKDLLRPWKTFLQTLNSAWPSGYIDSIDSIG